MDPAIQFAIGALMALMAGLTLGMSNRSLDVDRRLEAAFWAVLTLANGAVATAYLTMTP